MSDFTYIGQKPEEHECEFPKRGPFWNRNPIWHEGAMIQCNVCQKKYVLEYWPFSEMWDWAEYHE